MSEHKTLVEVQHLQQYFPAGGVGKNRKYVQAVDDVSFAIRKGETLGLVGESGCGKTTTGRTLLRLYEPTGGKIYYDGNLLFDKDNKIAVDMLPYRRRMQIVFNEDKSVTHQNLIGSTLPLEIHGDDFDAKLTGDPVRISRAERIDQPICRLYDLQSLNIQERTPPSACFGNSILT